MYQYPLGVARHIPGITLSIAGSKKARNQVKCLSVTSYTLSDGVPLTLTVLQQHIIWAQIPCLVHFIYQLPAAL